MPARCAGARGGALVVWSHERALPALHLSVCPAARLTASPPHPNPHPCFSPRPVLLPLPASSPPAPAVAHGQSNPTYLVSLRDVWGAQQGRLVLRKQPQGRLLRRAHAVDREYRVQAALAGLAGTQGAVPVARQHAYCADKAVVGAPFYVMEHVEGTVHVDRRLPGVPPRRRAAIYAELARCLAAVHAVDVAKAGLLDFGRADAYSARQVARWKRQYLADWGEQPMAEMVRLGDWLERNAPPAATTKPERPTLIHGDYRLDNVIFGGDAARAVLDWELSTLGDPMADLAYLCMTLYHAPPGEAPTPGAQAPTRTPVRVKENAQDFRRLRRGASCLGPLCARARARKGLLCLSCAVDLALTLVSVQARPR